MARSDFMKNNSYLFFSSDFDNDNGQISKYLKNKNVTFFYREERDISTEMEKRNLDADLTNGTRGERGRDKAH